MRTFWSVSFMFAVFTASAFCHYTGTVYRYPNVNLTSDLARNFIDSSECLTVNADYEAELDLYLFAFTDPNNVNSPTYYAIWVDYGATKAWFGYYIEIAGSGNDPGGAFYPNGATIGLFREEGSEYSVFYYESINQGGNYIEGNIDWGYPSSSSSFDYDWEASIEDDLCYDIDDTYVYHDDPPSPTCYTHYGNQNFTGCFDLDVYKATLHTGFGDRDVYLCKQANPSPMSNEFIYQSSMGHCQYKESDLEAWEINIFNDYISVYSINSGRDQYTTQR